MSKQYLTDLVERVLWTAAQAGVAFLAVESQEWGYEWVPVLAAVLAVLKGFIARQIGDPESASTLS